MNSHTNHHGDERAVYSNYLFVSDSNLMTDAFCKAFVTPKLSASIALSQVKIKPSIVWLHLSSTSNVAHQISTIKTHFPNVPYVILSNIPNDIEALASFSMAARGYANVHAGEVVLKNIANVVMQGGLWIGESIMQQLLSMPPAQLSNLKEGKTSWSTPLTNREKEVAKEIAIGASNKEIAEKMAITERTVKAHVGAVLEKLGLKNRLQLALLVKDR